MTDLAHLLVLPPSAAAISTTSMTLNPLNHHQPQLASMSSPTRECLSGCDLGPRLSSPSAASAPSSAPANKSTAEEAPVAAAAEAEVDATSMAAHNTRRRLSVDFLLNDEAAAAAAAAALRFNSANQTADSTSTSTSSSSPFPSASPSASTTTSPRSSGSHSTRCVDVDDHDETSPSSSSSSCATSSSSSSSLSSSSSTPSSTLTSSSPTNTSSTSSPSNIPQLPPLSALLSSSAPASPSAAPTCPRRPQQRAPAQPSHGRRRSWSIGTSVVRPSAFIPPPPAMAGLVADRRPVVSVASSGPLARGPPSHAPGSAFFMPITALPIVMDIDRDLADAELHYRQQQQQQLRQQQQQFRQQQHHQALGALPRQRRPQPAPLKRRVPEAESGLDRDEEEVARVLADPKRWTAASATPRALDDSDLAAASQHGHHQHQHAYAHQHHQQQQQQQQQQHCKRRRHSATPTLIAEAQRLFSSHLAATPVVPASEAKELKSGGAAASAADAGAPREAAAPAGPETTPMDIVSSTATTAAPTPAAAAAVESASEPAVVTMGEASGPALRKVETFQFSPDQQDLLMQVLERSQQREAQREAAAAAAGIHDLSLSSSSSSGSGSGNEDEGNHEDEDEAARLQRMTAKKRKRVNAQQLAVLEEYFAVDPMPNTLVKLKLAETLGMSPKRVQIWFQNKRARLKKGEQKKMQELQQRHVASRLLTYHNLRIDDNGHIVLRDDAPPGSTPAPLAATDSAPAVEATTAASAM